MFDQNLNPNEENFADISQSNTETEENIVSSDIEEEPIFQPEYIKIPKKEYVPTPKEVEISALKRASLAIGLSFLIFFIIRYTLSVVLALVISLFTSDYNKALEFLMNPAVSQVHQIIFSISVFTIPFILIYKLLRYRISDLISFKPVKAKEGFYYFLIGISFCSFANIASTMAERIFDSAGIEYEVDYGENPAGVFGGVLFFIATAIVPALVEEFACRGIIMGSLKKFGNGFAVIASAAVFGLMHGNFEQIPFAFLVGLALGYIVIKTESIWIAVAVHAFNNSIPVVYNYLLSSVSMLWQNISYIIFLILCLFAGLFAVAKLTNTPNAFRFDEDRCENSFGVIMKRFFLSVPIILFSSFCILESLMFFTF